MNDPTVWVWFPAEAAFLLCPSHPDGFQVFHPMVSFPPGQEYNKSTLRAEWRNRTTLTPAEWVGTLSLTGPAINVVVGYCQNTTPASKNYIQLMSYSNFPTGVDGFGRLAICVPFNSSCVFPILRKATITFVMSVCPSVQMEQLGSHWTDFHEIW